MLSGRLWPAHFRPLPDELFSSWVVRLALANGDKLHSFTKHTIGNTPLWNRDPDRSVSERSLAAFALKTNTTLPLLRNTTLRRYEGSIAARVFMTTASAQITTLGIHHRRRRHFGLQFCRMCLAEDNEPYFRTRWRLAMMPLCTKHRVVLADSCTNCEAPAMPHRCDVSDRDHAGTGSLSTCFECNSSLFEGELVSPDEDAFRMQNKLERSLCRLPLAGGADYTNLSPSLFDLVRGLFHLCSNSSKGARLRVQLASNAPHLEWPKVPEGVMIESMRARTRASYLSHVGWLVQDWPHRMRELVQMRTLNPCALIPENSGPLGPWVESYRKDIAPQAHQAKRLNRTTLRK